MRVALYGCGHMGRHHARHLGARPDVELVVVDPARGLDADPGEPDAVVIATPTPTHAEVARPWLAAGRWCLVEKPLAESLREARELAPHPRLRVGHVERFNPALSVLRGQDVRFFVAERLSPWTGRGADVDVVSDLMVHDLDLWLGLLAEAGDQVAEVRANGIAVASGQLDLVQARLESAQGRVATLTASRVSRGPWRRVRAFARGRYWSLDLVSRQASEASWGPGGLVEAPLALPGHDALAEQLTAFLAEVRGDTPAPGPHVATGPEALAAVELAERVRAAVR